MAPERSGRSSSVFVSKLLSLMLRHRPEEFGVEVDAHGFADLDQVVAALAERDAGIGQEDVESVVYDSEKKRFEIQEGRIRARYGHSISVDLGTDPVEPPEFLYKGVERRDANAVLRQGLEPGDRQYVHLSFDPDIASQLGGGRRRHPTVVIRVAALAAHKAGVPFYDCGPTILTPLVPPEYVSVDESSVADMESNSDSGHDVRDSDAPPEPVASGSTYDEPAPTATPTYGRRRKFKTGRR